MCVHVKPDKKYGKWLKKQARYSKFGDNSDSVLREKLIVAIGPGKILDPLFENEKNIWFQKVFNIITAAESVQSGYGQTAVLHIKREPLDV